MCRNSIYKGFSLDTKYPENSHNFFSRIFYFIYAHLNPPYKNVALRGIFPYILICAGKGIYYPMILGHNTKVYITQALRCSLHRFILPQRPMGRHKYYGVLTTKVYIECGPGVTGVARYTYIIHVYNRY